MDHQNNSYGRVPEQDQVQDRIRDGMSGDRADGHPDSTAGNFYNGASGGMPGNFPGGAPGGFQNGMPGAYPNGAPGGVPITVRSLPQQENSMSTSALILAVIGAISSLLLLFCPFLPFIFLGISIVLALLSRGSSRRFSPHAKAGLITSLCSLGMIFLIFTALFAFVIASGDLAEEWERAGEGYYDDFYDDIYNDFQEFYY